MRSRLVRFVLFAALLLQLCLLSPFNTAPTAVLARRSGGGSGGSHRSRVKRASAKKGTRSRSRSAKQKQKSKKAHSQKRKSKKSVSKKKKSDAKKKQKKQKKKKQKTKPKKKQEKTKQRKERKTAERTSKATLRQKRSKATANAKTRSGASARREATQRQQKPHLHDTCAPKNVTSSPLRVMTSRSRFGPFLLLRCLNDLIDLVNGGLDALAVDFNGRIGALNVGIDALPKGALKSDDDARESAVSALHEQHGLPRRETKLVSLVSGANALLL
jgi:hypothetical protein